MIPAALLLLALAALFRCFCHAAASVPRKARRPRTVNGFGLTFELHPTKGWRIWRG